MERYRLVKELGEGACGSVLKAITNETGEVVAIKQMRRRYDSWEECLNLRELKSSQNLHHPSIVMLEELVRENSILYFVFEFMEKNLYQVISDKKILFSEVVVRNMCRQVFQGLAYMHQKGLAGIRIRAETRHGISGDSIYDSIITFLPPTS